MPGRLSSLRLPAHPWCASSPVTSRAAPHPFQASRSSRCVTTRSSPPRPLIPRVPIGCGFRKASTELPRIFLHLRALNSACRLAILRALKRDRHPANVPAPSTSRWSCDRERNHPRPSRRSLMRVGQVALIGQVGLVWLIGLAGQAGQAGQVKQLGLVGLVVEIGLPNCRWYKRKPRALRTRLRRRSMMRIPRPGCCPRDSRPTLIPMS